MGVCFFWGLFVDERERDEMKMDADGRGVWSERYLGDLKIGSMEYKVSMGGSFSLYRWIFLFERITCPTTLDMYHSFNQKALLDMCLIQEGTSFAPVFKDDFAV